MEESIPRFFDAIKHGHHAAVEEMLEKNPLLAASRDPGGMSAVLTALYFQEETIARLLIERDAPLTLFEASAGGEIDVVRKMLDEAPDQIHAWSPDGFQPLGLASFFGRADLVALLLERGAPTGEASHNLLNVQPLHSAVAGRHHKIVRMLLERGADPNARQGEGFTPLHGAAQNGDVETIRLLLAHGADPSARNNDGLTPAAFAAVSGQEEAARLLEGPSA